MAEQGGSHGTKYVAIGVAIAAVALAVVVTVWQSGGMASGGPTQQWFFDVGTGQRFPGPMELGPVPAPSNSELKEGVPGGVMAHVYGCGSCNDKAAQFTAYIEWLPPEHRTMPQGQWPRLKQVSAVTDGSTELKWVGMSTPEGQQVLAAAQQKCGDQPAVKCQP